MKYFLGFLLSSLASIALAGNILAEGTIYNVGNTNNSAVNNFAIFIKSATTVPCPEGYGIVFSVTNAPTEKAFDRAFTMALAAQLSGKKVIVYGMQDNNCNSAAFITIVN